MSKPNETRSSRTVKSAVDYYAWFISEVEKALAAADQGEFTDHEDIRAMIK